MKQCNKCLTTKSIDQFIVIRGKPSTQCKECKNEYLRGYQLKNKTVLAERNAERNAKRYQEDPDIYRKSLMKSRYKISLDEYNAMLEGQDYGCMICGGINESGRALAVDHDHTCCPGKTTCGECMRGLLCSNCNRALGLFKDDSELLKKAAAYLESYR